MNNLSKEITSRDNPAVKQYVQLAASRKARYEQQLFVTEGMKLTAEAFMAGYRPELFFATEDALDRYYEDAQPIALNAAQFLRISPSIAEKLAQSVSTQGVFCVFQMLDNEVTDAKIDCNGKFLLLSSLQDPGNIGTILRTAAAFGVDGVILSEDCPDLYSPKVLRASMGGVFKVPVRVTDDLCGCIRKLKDSGIVVYAAALDDSAISVRELSLKSGCAVVIGNEGSGLPDELIGQCSQTIMIPMQPGNESLNAAMAAGIILWEMNGK